MIYAYFKTEKKNWELLIGWCLPVASVQFSSIPLITGVNLQGLKCVSKFQLASRELRQMTPLNQEPFTWDCNAVVSYFVILVFIKKMSLLCTIRQYWQVALSYEFVPSVVVPSSQRYISFISRQKPLVFLQRALNILSSLNLRNLTAGLGDVDSIVLLAHSGYSRNCRVWNFCVGFNL